MKVQNIFIGLILIGVVLVVMVPDVFNWALAGLIGVGGLTAACTRKKIKDVKEMAGAAVQQLAEKDAQAKQIKQEFDKAVEVHQELGVTIHGKLSSERQALEEEKQQIRDDKPTPGDAANFIRDQLNKR